MEYLSEWMSVQRQKTFTVGSAVSPADKQQGVSGYLQTKLETSGTSLTLILNQLLYLMQNLFISLSTYVFPVGV